MKQNKLKLGIAIGIFATLGTLNVNAQKPDHKEKPKGPPSYQELLKKMDENNDGKLSENEVEGPLKNDFSKIDTNEDGFITEEELKKAPKPKRRGKCKKCKK